MKIKYKNLEAEVKAEEVAKQIIDNKEKDWKAKLESRTIAKKEIMELKHKNKMEEQITKRMNDKDLKKYYKEKNNQKITQESNSESVNKYKVLSIIMFFIYGIFCILGFHNQHIVSAIISLIQFILTVISIFTSMKFFNLFNNDYKIFFMISILLIIPWLMFAV